MINKLYKKTIPLLLPLSLIACGGGGGGGGGTSVVSPGTVVMELNTSYTVSAGDKIVPTSTDPQLRIVKDSNQSTSTVTLLSGSAQINRG